MTYINRVHPKIIQNQYYTHTNTHNFYWINESEYIQSMIMWHQGNENQWAHHAHASLLILSADSHGQNIHRNFFPPICRSISTFNGIYNNETLNHINSFISIRRNNEIELEHNFSSNFWIIEMLPLRIRYFEHKNNGFIQHKI